MMLRSVLVYVLLIHGWLGQCVVTSSFNGTTTLDEQANINVGDGRDSPDRINHFKFRPHVSKFDSSYSGAGSLGVYVKPPYKHQRRPPLPPPPLPPPIHHTHHLQQLPHPPKYYPYPLEPGYSDDYYSGDDECSLVAPLLALKTAFVALFKVAVAKLPFLAVKLFAKIVAFFVVLGPLLLPLLLLFPVPVFGFNTFGNGFAITGNGGGGNFNPNNVGGGGNIPNGNLNNNPNFKQDGRQAAISRLPQFARGPCLPRMACEMGYWAYRERVAWILDHATENATPIFPKLFNSWKRAYHLGGKGRDCGSLYFCPTADRVIAVIEKNNLEKNNQPPSIPLEVHETVIDAAVETSQPRAPSIDKITEC